MAKFTDCLGREWTLRLTLGHRAGLKALGVDTSDVGAAFSSLATAAGVDVERLARVCHLLTVEPVSYEEYERGWDADAAEAAGRAVEDAVTDFFLSRRPATAAAVKANFRAAVEQMDRMTADRLTRSGSGTNSPGTPG